VKEELGVESKVWYHSKQLWTAVIAMVATAIQAKYGFVVDPIYQGYALGAIMFFLRIITKEPVTLTKIEAPPPDNTYRGV
jgi:hypothetical protein